MSEIVGVIQARMDSTRLPGKVLMPLAGAPMLERLIERARRSSRVSAWVVATTRSAADDAIVALCGGLGCAVHRGSESDVLGRVLEAAGDAATIVRLTADNPFVDGELVDSVVTTFLAMSPSADYADNVEDGGFPHGLYVEVAATKALRRALAEGDAQDREHVTWYIRRHRDAFRTVTFRAPVALDQTPLSIDTSQDYARLSVLFERLYRADPAFSWQAATMAATQKVRVKT